MSEISNIRHMSYIRNPEAIILRKFVILVQQKKSKKYLRLHVMQALILINEVQGKTDKHEVTVDENEQLYYERNIKVPIHSRLLG